GALGDGTKIDSWTPVTVSSPNSVQLVGPEAGGFHTCARSVAGSVYCWGRNGSGQVGDSTAFERILPFEVSAPAGVAFTHLSVGVDDSCAESSDGQVYCWGRNEDDRLGDGSGGDRATPAPVGA